MSGDRSSERRTMGGMLCAGWVLLVVGLGGCASLSALVSPSPAEEDEAAAVVDPREIVCAEDASIDSLRARFRVATDVGGSHTTLHGMLLVSPERHVRLKLWSFFGVTVYDAIWRRDAAGVHGWVWDAGSGEASWIDVGTGVLPQEAALSIALWGLWQPRCANGAPGDVDAAGWLRLAPGPNGLARAVRVDRGVIAQERLHFGVNVMTEYRARTPQGGVSLPREISLRSESDRWRARVRISEYDRTTRLEPGLFVLPLDGAAPVGRGRR